MPTKVHQTISGPAIGLRVQFYATLADVAAAVADAAWLADTDHLLLGGNDGAEMWTTVALEVAEDLAAKVTRRIALDRLRIRFERCGYAAANNDEREAMFFDFPERVAHATAVELFPELVPSAPGDTAARL